VAKIKALIAVVAVLAVSISADAVAQSKKNKRQEAPPEPVVQMIAIPMGTKTKAIEVDKVVGRIGAGTTVGYIGYSFFCGQRDPLVMRGGTFKFDDASYDDQLRASLMSLNYNVVGNPTALFKDKDAGKAEILIGGLIKGMNIEACGPTTKFTTTYTGDGKVTVEWQVFDTLARQVVLQKTTIGKSKVTFESREEIEQVVIAAFGDAVKNFLADPALSQLVMEVDSSAAPNSVASAAVNVPSTLISRLPLSKRSFQDHATDIRGNVVTVFAGQGSGSGFFVSDRQVITNAHVVQGAKFVKLRLITGREILGEVMASDELRDVALIQSEAAGFVGLPVREDELPVGSQVFVVGSPRGESNEGTVSAGIVSSYRISDGQRWIQSDVNVMPGNSGGPMLDDKGNIIGLTSWGKTDPRTGSMTGLNFFIPITDAMAKLGLKFR
jgi:S1-C subfamily serine protease